MLYKSNHLLMYPGPWENQIVPIGLSYMYTSGPYQWATTPRACTTFSYLPFWTYSPWISQHASPLGSMIQDIKGKFLWCVKFQHVTSSIWISPSCSNVSELAVDLKCVGCISAGKQWDNLWLGVSNQQHDWAIIISVGIFDNFQRVSMSSHIGVRWLYWRSTHHHFWCHLKDIKCME